MRLTPDQEAMQEGRRGWPRQLAVEMLCAVGKVHGATELVPIDSVHLGISGKSLGEPGRRLLERLASEGGRFVVPTTLNVLSAERAEWDGPGLDAAAETQRGILRACEAMGGAAICSCNPFLLGIAPAFGRSVAWNESATAPYINAVLGGRANREGATALASALTGLTPLYGMHLAENRLGGRVVEVDAAIDGLDGFSALGSLVGRLCGDLIPVVCGLPAPPSAAEHLAFSAALATFSTVAMYHMPGITPEAPTRAAALGGRSVEVARIGPAELAAERGRLGAGVGERLDLVAIGCPHASLAQLHEVRRLLAGRPVAGNVGFLIHASAEVRRAAERDGLLGGLGALNVTVTADTCLHVAFGKVAHGRHVATNSAKMAHLLSSDGAASVRFGAAAALVEAAVAGRWTGY